MLGGVSIKRCQLKYNHNYLHNLLSILPFILLFCCFRHRRDETMHCVVANQLSLQNPKYIDKWGTQRANTFIYIVQ